MFVRVHINELNRLIDNQREDKVMVRPRIHDKDLPQNVIKRHNAYYYTTPSGHWKRLATVGDLSGMYAALSKAIETGDSGGMDELLTLYEKRLLPAKAPKTQKDYKRYLNDLRTKFGARNPDTITTAELAEYMDTDPHPTVANRRLATLSVVFTAGLRWGKCRSNPCLQLRRHKEQPRHVYVTSTTFWDAWNSAPQHLGLAMEMSLVTGQRLADVLGLRWSEVSSKGLLFVQNKTGKALLVESTEWLSDLLARCKETSNHSSHVLVNTYGQPWSTSGFNTAWQRFMRKRPQRFQFRDIRKKSGNDGTTGAHLGNDVKTFEKWYRLKPKRVQGLSGREEKHVLDTVLDKDHAKL